MHELIQKASDYAIEKHGNQKYGGEIAYHKHLEEVYKVLLRFGFTEEKDLDILIASFLHDIIEDTATSYSDVKRIFSFLAGLCPRCPCYVPIVVARRY